MRRSVRRAAVWVLLFFLISASDAAAQRGRVRLSQPGTVSQTVDSTVITLVYTRPGARGRTLFGELVPWGRMWHPGANEATTLEVSDDILVGGQELSKGRYSLWVIPTREQWTWIFSRVSDVWHTRYPGEGADALRLTLTPVTGDHMETLAYYFPVVGRDSVVLNFHWGTTIVEIPIHLKPRD